MPGKATILSGFTYPDTTGKTKYPIDATNLALAELAADAGITRVLDPEFLRTPVGAAQSLPDLNTADVWAVTGLVALGQAAALVNGHPVLDFIAANKHGMQSPDIKTETSFSVMMYVEQQASDQAVAVNKILLDSAVSGSGYFWVRQNSNSTTMTVNANGTSQTFSFATGAHILLFSYDNATRQVVVQDTTGTVLTSFTAVSAVTDSYKWDVGGVADGTASFDGRIGQVVFCNKALHLAANASALASMRALMRAKYAI